jgi:hypothetical protein
MQLMGSGFYFFASHLCDLRLRLEAEGNGSREFASDGR